MTQVTRPALRYHGGKFRLAPWIISFFPEHDVYVEPFGGAASVLLQKKPAKSEVYNDIADEIVNVFRVLRDPAQAARLARMVELTPFARTEFELSYELSDDPIEQARRTVVRSFMGHGGGAVYSKHATGFRTGIRGSPNHVGSSSSWTIQRALRDHELERRNSQQVLKATAARPDATDRERTASTSPGVGPMGVGQPADAGPLAGQLVLFAEATA